MKIKILHSADNHLMDRHLTRIDRADDFRAGMRQFVDKAIELKVNAGILAGDVFNNRRPSPANVQFMAQMHERLKQANIPVYCVRGNHDYTDPNWVTALFAESDAKAGFLGSDYRRYEIPCGEGQISILCLPYMPKDELLAYFKNNPQKADVVVWHGAIKEMTGFPMDSAVSLDELPVNRFRYWALGDIHKRTVVERDGSVLCYPGPTEMCSKDEDLEKSVTLVSIGLTGSVEIEHIPIKTRAMRCYRFTTEEDLENALVELAEIKKTAPNVMVFVRYNRGIPRVFARLSALLDPDKAIIRAEPFNPLAADINEVKKFDAEHCLKPEDFLGEFITPGTELYTLAKALINPEADAKDLVSDYVFKAIQNYENKINKN
jgi:DNA repair exonuclease SbcCD nuclease subunit